jgi:voltage-gated potassium channel
VGYGDISPSTVIGRIIASILRLVEIGTIGMLTGTIATYFLPKKDIRNDSNAVEKNIMESTDITEEEKNNRLYKIFKI